MMMPNVFASRFGVPGAMPGAGGIQRPTFGARPMPGGGGPIMADPMRIAAQLPGAPPPATPPVGTMNPGNFNPAQVPLQGTPGMRTGVGMVNPPAQPAPVLAQPQPVQPAQPVQGPMRYNPNGQTMQNIFAQRAA